MYKILLQNSILRKSDNTSIPRDDRNRDYRKFVEDVRTLGLEIVEGADVQTQSSYVDARREEYPSLEDQLDKIYHHGINSWMAGIKAIKDKYPKTQVGITSIADLPDWVIELRT